MCTVRENTEELHEKTFRLVFLSLKCAVLLDIYFFIECPHIHRFLFGQTENIEI